MQARAQQYKSPDAAINYCIGRWLLQKAIAVTGLPPNTIHDVYYSVNNKPLLAGLHFSISHSGPHVALAFSDKIPMGLDVQIPEPIQLLHFKRWFNQDEWVSIMNADNPVDGLYWFWVRKESILKAADVPLAALGTISIEAATAGTTKNDKRRWLLQALHCFDDAYGMLAFEKQPTAIELIDCSHNLY